MKRLFQHFSTRSRRFFSSESGSVMMVSGFLFPIIAGAAVFAMDHVIVAEKISNLQRAADRTAIAVAREMPLIKNPNGDDDVTLTAIAANYAEQSLPDAELNTNAHRESDSVVGINLTMMVTTPLSRFFGGDQQLTAEAKAEVFGGQNVCIISTETGRNNPGISLENQAQINAGDCGIYSNSEQPHSIRTRESAHIEANFICSAGGFDGSDGSVSTAVTTDCPQISDPLSGRPAPPIKDCYTKNTMIIGANENITLSPGTYCGGLTIQANANVWFGPGIYTFKGGPLLIVNDAVASGENVGLHFIDESSYFDFRDDAEITFSAPETGPMAGIVVLATKLCKNSGCVSPRTFKITSAKVRSLLGTISLPQDDLEIDTTMPVSEDAAFTILIVDNLVMKQSPALVLNTDYAATSVPVPAGFAGQPSTRLVK